MLKRCWSANGTREAEGMKCKVLNDVDGGAEVKADVWYTAKVDNQQKVRVQLLTPNAQ
jgi:hypothetical protein